MGDNTIMKTVENIFLDSIKLLEDFSTEENFKLIHKCGTIISESIKKGNKVISCGNGGSMSDAMHFAEELTGKFRENRRSLPAIAISDPSYITCTANDYGYDKIFSRFLEGMGNEGDVLLAISTSGNSSNIINAINTALDKNMKVIALTGKDGGAISEIKNVNEIRVPYNGYSDRIQEIHIKIIHSLVNVIEEELF